MSPRRDPQKLLDAIAAEIRGHVPCGFEICEQATREAGMVVPANYNCPGQLVISGTEAGVERAIALFKEAGAKRAMRLNVSGAFHSPLMEPAVAGLSEALEDASFDNPHFAVLGAGLDPWQRVCRQSKCDVDRV